MKKKLEFYDLAKRKKFATENYREVVKSGRRFAVAKNSTGKECWRVLGRAK